MVSKRWILFPSIEIPSQYYKYQLHERETERERERERGRPLACFASRERDMGFAIELFLSLFVAVFACMVIYLYNSLVLRPQLIRAKLGKQGIRGPPPSLFYGNVPQMKKIASEALKTPSRDQIVLHDYPSTLLPYLGQWRKDYGDVFMYSMGTNASLYVSNPNMVKDLSVSRSFDLARPLYLSKERAPMFGHGIISSNGKVWSRQRKLIAPELYMDKVKDMVNLMVESAIPLLELWESRMQSKGGVGNIRIDEDLKNFSADVIARACFGSSYSEGKEIFEMIRTLQRVMSEQNTVLGVPGLRFIPSKNNREIWRLERNIRCLILNLVKERRENLATASEKDLLTTILESATSDGDFETKSANNFIVDNCKSIYFAGHETTSISATWTLVLLSLNPIWQTRVRAEVLEVCGGRVPDVENIRKMKTLTMVIHESLRLYPPAPFITREVFEEMKFGDVKLPVGTNIWIPVAALHQDKESWGPDAHTFNPERFSHGISGACKIRHIYMPFGFGPRTCIGQNIALVELKVLLSLILSRFTFSLSPDYRHSPRFTFVLEPKTEVNLLMERV